MVTCRGLACFSGQPPWASEAGGMQGIEHPNDLCGGVGDIDMYIPLEKSNTIAMQTVCNTY